MHAMEDGLTEPLVAEYLSTVWLGRTYRYFEKTDSTNDLLKQEVALGGPSEPPRGTVFLTDYQQQGRGRFDRRWEAPPQSSLLFSVLFRPGWTAEKLSWLTMLAGLSVAEAIEREANLPVSLKWPNDVVIQHDGHWAKVCGILLEGAISTAQRLEHAVAGIGINVNVPAAQLPRVDQPVTSLALAAGHQLPRLPLLAAILKQLEWRYEEAERGESPWEPWNDRLITLGKRVVVHRFEQAPALEGVAVATDEWGGLLIRDDEDAVHAVMAADVTLRETQS